MSGKLELPSKWWFCGIPALANLYAMLGILGVIALYARCIQRATARQIFGVLGPPFVWWLNHLGGPILNGLGGMFGIAPGCSPVSLAIGTLVLWEMSALVVGAGLYGLAAIAHILFAGGGDSGAGETPNSSGL